MVTAAVPKTPDTLVGQLKESGLLIVPLGYEWTQELMACQKQKGKIIEKFICDVRFVKLVGKYGFLE
jgi:protein-L-isoaspartate(D-aspartate) O-methyltransferase